MPLGVFSDVKKQADHGRGKALATHTPRLAEGDGIERSYDCFCIIKGSIDKRQQLVAAQTGGFVLRLESRKLPGV